MHPLSPTLTHTECWVGGVMYMCGRYPLYFMYGRPPGLHVLTAPTLSEAQQQRRRQR